jgi:hypothetical protein
MFLLFELTCTDVDVQRMFEEGDVWENISKLAETVK